MFSHNGLLKYNTILILSIVILIQGRVSALLEMNLAASSLRKIRRKQCRKNGKPMEKDDQLPAKNQAVRENDFLVFIPLYGKMTPRFY